MAEVRLVGVEKRWGSFTAVAKQSLDVMDGEFLVLLGPSGCGKTTTMRMVAGLEEPSEGEIWIGDRCVTHLMPKDRDVAMVFQNYGLYPHMSVAENIGYPLKVRRMARAEREDMVIAAARKVELDGLLQRRPRALSGGQRQRVALARAIVRTPDVFLMDEPLSNLDAKLRVTMRSEIKHLQYELGITTLYVTHDQIEAMTLAHRVAVMNEGQIQQLGHPQEIYDRPANLFVAGFIGSPPMNLIPSKQVGNEIVAEGMKIESPLRGGAEALVVGVRPEDLSIAELGSGEIQGRVYATELTGDSVNITIEVGRVRVIAKAERTFSSAIGTAISLKITPGQVHFFDAVAGQRIVTGAPEVQLAN